MGSTIVAISTPIGFSGIGIVRLSGPKVKSICKYMLKQCLQPRLVTNVFFYNFNGDVIDCGLSVFFKKPKSFTGEDVVELYCHGNPLILSNLVSLSIRYGAREARNGEFTMRAFLNKKINLFQAEAVYNLIEAKSVVKIDAVLGNLKGFFLKKFKCIINEFYNLRSYVEADVNFSELSLVNVFLKFFELMLKDLCYRINFLLLDFFYTNSEFTNSYVVIVGKPNAGKSSLFNFFLKSDFSIVTDVPGTTRDSLIVLCSLFNYEITLVDTAGLNFDTDDYVEMKGVEKTKLQLQQADLILFVIDSSVDCFYYPETFFSGWKNFVRSNTKIIYVMNKIDLSKMKRNLVFDDPRLQQSFVYTSTKTGEGLVELQHKIVHNLNFNKSGDSQNFFELSRRHVDLLLKIRFHLERCFVLFKNDVPLDMLAEEFYFVYCEFMKISGKVYTYDLLDDIFSKFCIGK